MSYISYNPGCVKTVNENCVTIKARGGFIPKHVVQRAVDNLKPGTMLYVEFVKKNGNRREMVGIPDLGGNRNPHSLTMDCPEGWRAFRFDQVESLQYICNDIEAEKN